MAQDIEGVKPEETTNTSTDVVEKGSVVGEENIQDNGGDDDYVWDFGDEDNDAPPATEVNTTGSDDRVSKSVPEKEWWQVAAEKTGIKAASEDEYLTAIKKPSGSTEVYVDTNDPEVSRITGYLNQDDESLVRAALEAEGWSEEKIDKRISQEAQNGQLEFTAEGIRGTLRKAVKERQTLLQEKQSKQRAEEATLYQTASDNAIKAIAETDKIFGFKVAKDEKGVQNWREKISRDIQSGQTLKAVDEIIKDARDGKPERFIELAQWLRSKDGIIRGLVQKGKAEKSEELLDELRNTSGSDKPNPDNSTGGKKHSKGWFTDPALQKK